MASAAVTKLQVLCSYLDRLAPILLRFGPHSSVGLVVMRLHTVPYGQYLIIIIFVRDTDVLFLFNRVLSIAVCKDYARISFIYYLIYSKYLTYRSLLELDDVV
jgi:hypothetical protein